MNEQNWQEIAKIFEDAKKQVEAVLKPKAATCEDYGEPITIHHENSENYFVNRRGVRFADISATEVDRVDIRAATCVNALAGIPDPAAFVAAARELVEHCKAKPLVSRNNSSFEYAKGASVKDIHDWINDLESLVADAEAVAT